MLTSMPETVRQALGEDVARDFTAWLEDGLETRTVNRAEWTQAMVRLGTIEHDVGDIKAELRKTNERLDRMGAQFDERLDRMGAQFDERLDRMNAEFNRRFDDMGARFDRLQEQMASHMRWSIGLLAVFGTLIAILVGVGQLAPLFLP